LILFVYFFISLFATYNHIKQTGVTTINYYTRFIFAAIIPIIVLALIFGCYVLPFYIYHYRHQSLDGSAMATRTRQAWKLLLFTLFLIYPKVVI
jgi:hypothetical protein